DVDEVAHEVTVRAHRDGQVARVLGQVDGEQGEDREDPPDELVPEDPGDEAGCRAGAVHDASPPWADSTSPGWSVAAAGTASAAAMGSTMCWAVTSGPLTISPILRWSLSTTIRSLRRTTSSSSEEMNTTETPPSARTATASWISAFAPTSMPRVGSSRMSSSG